MTSSDAIAYHQGQFYLDNDNSLNDYLSVADDGQVMGFKPPGMWIGANDFREKNLLNAEQAGEYLWRRFTEGLR